MQRDLQGLQGTFIFIFALSLDLIGFASSAQAEMTTFQLVDFGKALQANQTTESNRNRMNQGGSFLSAGAALPTNRTTLMPQGLARQEAFPNKGAEQTVAEARAPRAEQTPRTDHAGAAAYTMQLEKLLQPIPAGISAEPQHTQRAGEADSHVNLDTHEVGLPWIELPPSPPPMGPSRLLTPLATEKSVPASASCPKAVPTLPTSAVCGDGNLEVTVWDLMYDGSPCSISLGPLPSDISTATLYACTGTLYGKPCTGIKDKLNILFYQQQPTAPTVLQMSSHLDTLGVSGLTQATSLGVLLIGTPSTPIEPVFLPNLRFITGDLLVSGLPELAPLGLGPIRSLANLQQIGGNLVVQATAWANAASLTGLTCVGSNAAFVNNGNLASFTGLENWAAVHYQRGPGTNLVVFNNTRLAAMGYSALRTLAKCLTGAVSPVTGAVNATASVGAGCPTTASSFTGICMFAQQGICAGVP
eukprot:jgi/Botrbrau1/10784/Bobra.0119s0010.1